MGFCNISRYTANNVCVYSVMPGAAELTQSCTCGAQLTNKTHFYYEKLNSYEHLQILWGQVPPVLFWFRHLCVMLNYCVTCTT